jgi:hypothetical protein
MIASTAGLRDTFTLFLAGCQIHRVLVCLSTGREICVRMRVRKRFSQYSRALRVLCAPDHQMNDEDKLAASFSFHGCLPLGMLTLRLFANTSRQRIRVSSLRARAC